MTTTITVMDADGHWQAEVDSWTHWVVLAALSAEPATLDELAAAIRRYQPDHQLLEGDRSPQKLDLDLAEVPHGAWCLIDLVGQTIVGGNGMELPEDSETYEREEHEPEVGFPVIWIHLPPEWQMMEAGGDWQALVTERARTAQSHDPLDARAILFGKPLVEFLADRVLAVSADGLTDKEQCSRATRGIHAAWLMTARQDLANQTPRELLLARRDWIDAELDRRSHQWSMQRKAPPALPATSRAYRFGGFGIVEIVIYFDLVRALLKHAWQLRQMVPGIRLRDLVQQLERRRDEWLTSPLEAEDFGEAPAALIHLERRRMPITDRGTHLDCDCPICRQMASGDFGPMFMGFDGHHLELEGEFAFSLCPTREAWEAQQAEWNSGVSIDNDEDDDNDGEEVAVNDEVDEEGKSVWQSSYVNWDLVSREGYASPLVRSAIVFLVAEIIGDLKGLPQGQPFREALNETCDQFGTAKSETAIREAARELCRHLERTGRSFPQCISKCADLQSRIDEVMRMQQPQR